MKSLKTGGRRTEKKDQETAETTVLEINYINNHFNFSFKKARKCLTSIFLSVFTNFYLEIIIDLHSDS